MRLAARTVPSFGHTLIAFKVAPPCDRKADVIDNVLDLLGLQVSYRVNLFVREMIQ
jgi:hypothetical protein